MPLIVALTFLSSYYSDGVEWLSRLVYIDIGKAEERNLVHTPSIHYIAKPAGVLPWFLICQSQNRKGCLNKISDPSAGQTWVSCVNGTCDVSTLIAMKKHRKA